METEKKGIDKLLEITRNSGSVFAEIDWRLGDKNNPYQKGTGKWSEYERRWGESEIEYDVR